MLTVFAKYLVALLWVAAIAAGRLPPRTGMGGAKGRHIQIGDRSFYVRPFSSLLTLLLRAASLFMCMVSMTAVEEFIEAAPECESGKKHIV